MTAGVEAIHRRLFSLIEDVFDGIRGDVHCQRNGLDLILAKGRQHIIDDFAPALRPADA